MEPSKTRKPRPAGNGVTANFQGVQTNYTVTTAAAETAFTAAMAEAGIVTADPIVADGQLHRIHIDGHRRGTRNGAYVLHGDGIAAGWYQDFVSGLAGTWRKWIEDASGWKQIAIENVLFVPVVSPDGQLVNVQAILPESHPALDGNKFFNGGRKKGCLFWIGEPTGTVMIAEGYATGASLHELTDSMVVVAFDCGNLMDVAVTVRKSQPEATIILCGDNDRKTPGNPGLTKAREAALAIGAKLLIPQFDDGESGSDWNDWLTNRRFSGSPKKLNLSISPLEAFTGREAQHGV